MVGSTPTGNTADWGQPMQPESRLACRMDMNLKHLLLLPVAIAAMATTARAEITVDIFAEVRLGRAQPPRPPEIIVVEQSAPPRWTPDRPRWYQRSHAYYYYPGYDVYYNADNQMWFYLEHGQWRSSNRLPDGIRIDFSRSVALTLTGDRPYLHNNRVVTSYPSNYFTRVKFKNDHDNRRDDHNERDNDRKDAKHDDRRNDRDKRK